MLKKNKIASLIAGLAIIVMTILHTPSLELKHLMSTVASAVWGS
jgi:hypothetical protein